MGRIISVPEKDNNKTGLNVYRNKESVRAMEQIPLFLEDHVLANTADADLAVLRLSEAIDGYRTYTEFYGADADIARKRILAEFLRDGLCRIPFADRNCPDDLCELWDAFEHEARDQGLRKDGLLPDIRKSFFQHATDVLTRYHADNLPGAGNHYPAGYVFMKAGAWKQAIHTLRARIASDPDNARFYGYLGDAFYLGGNLDAASQCYFEASLIDLAALDWRNMQNHELLLLRQKLMEDRDGHDTNGEAWIAVQAYLHGMIFPRPVDQKLKLAELVDRYLEKERAYIENRQVETAAQIFLIGIVLCAHEPLLRQIKGADFAAIRARMKDINPTLFEQYLKSIRKQQKRQCGNQ
jgi:tetratricopeptide (TPR) repeat protein